MDKWDVDVVVLLELFLFLLSWCVDDIMVFYVEFGGGVGVYVD